jgi:putative membrane protein insertion efficiency factor
VSPGQFLIILSLRFYRRFLSPAKTAVFGPLGQCRYAPTCSGYALDAVRSRGAVTGGWLALKRLARCHPWGGAGYDPVPPARETAASSEPGCHTLLCHCEAVASPPAFAPVKAFPQDLRSHGS